MEQDKFERDLVAILMQASDMLGEYSKFQDSDERVLFVKGFIDGFILESIKVGLEKNNPFFIEGIENNGERKDNAIESRI